MENSKFYGGEGYYRVFFYNSLVNIKKSLFNTPIQLNGNNNLTIKYSSLYKVYGSNNKEKFVNLSSNWWKLNNGPSIGSIENKFKPENWIIVNFTSKNPLIRAKDEILRLTLKFTDGKKSWDIDKDIDIIDIPASFECENGKFTINSGIIKNHILETEYLNNTEETIIYGIVNKERLKLLIGRGFTNYTIYVSTDGNDVTGNGSKENPFKTLGRALNKALNGNTICIYSGIYTGYENSNLNIRKNITFKTYNGPVTIRTYMNNNIFTSEEWGTLNIYGINFISDKNNANIIISSNGGDINLENCSFNNILSPKLIYVKQGYKSSGNLFINNTSFKNISGIAIFGNPKIKVYNSNFTGFTKYGNYYDYKTVISTNNNIHIENCNFIDNNIGTIYSKDNSAGLIYTPITEVKIINSTFINNNGLSMDTYGNTLPVIGFEANYANPIYIENCKFIRNQGHCINGANYIINSSFISNYGDTTIKNGNEYYGNNLSIYNSSFINNTNNNTKSQDYYNQGIVFNGGILNVENTSFINNSASYGGAIYNYNIANIKYSIFLNNKATYLGNDVFNRLGKMNASSNWWGSNEGPISDKAYRFLGDLILDNWIIMTLNLDNYTNDNYTVKVGLNKLTNSKKEIFDTEYTVPDTRIVYFNCTYGKINQTSILLNNGTGYVLVISNLKNHDAILSARIDQQVLNLRISNKSTKILIENYAIYGDKQNINMTLINVNGYKISNQTLYVSFVNSTGENQETYRVKTDDNGFAKLELNLTPDMYTIIIKYEGNSYFEKSNATALLNVLITTTNLIGYNQIYYGKNNDFYVIIKDSFNNPLINKMIYFNISNGKDHYIFITNSNPNGRADISLSINPGKYTINAYFKGDKWYTGSNISLNVTIYPSNTKIISSNKTLYGYGDIYSVKLLDNESNPIKGETIELTISKGNISQTFKLETNDEANAEIAINLLPDTYNITAIYKGNKNYSPCEAKSTIKVEKVLSRIISNLNVNLTKTNDIVLIKLIDLYGKAITNQTVILIIYERNNTYTFESNTDEEGISYITVNLNPGEYQGTVSYQGNSWYNQTSTGISLSKDTNSNTTNYINLTADNFIQYYGEDKYFNITFYDPNAKSQSNKLIVVSIIGKSSYRTYNLTTDIDGIARLQIQLNPGIYTITYKYDNIYYGIHVNGTNNISILKTPTVISLENITIKYNTGELYEITLKDINGNTLNNKKITLNLNSAYGVKEYNLTTDNYGIVRLKTNLNIGTYIIKVKYNGDNNYYNSSNTSTLIIKGSSNKIPTKIECKDMTQEAVDFYQGERGGYFKLTLKDKNNKVISNKMLQIGFNGVVYNVVTDKNGVGKLQINLAFPGVYTFAIAFLSDNKYEGSFSVAKITITKKTLKIIAPTKTYRQKTKSKYITVTLKDRKNRVIKEKQLKIKVNNKIYTVKTNNKGIATLKINLNNKKIYTYIVSYSGDNRYNKVTATGKIRII